EPLDQAGTEAREVSGAAIADLLAWIWRTRQGWAGAEPPGRARRNQSAGGNGPGPLGLRLGGFAVSGDGVDAGRLRRHRRLAAAECAGEHGQRRFMGF